MITKSTTVASKSYASEPTTYLPELFWSQCYTASTNMYAGISFVNFSGMLKESTLLGYPAVSSSQQLLCLANCNFLHSK
jgi:hypothetical protein